MGWWLLTVAGSIAFGVYGTLWYLDWRSERP